MISFNELYDSVKDSWEYKAESIKFDVSNKFGLVMDEKGWNNAKLAEQLGVSRAYITKVLNGQQNLSIDTMCKISSALDVDVCVHIAKKGVDVRWFEVVTNSKPKDQLHSKIKKVSFDDVLSSGLERYA